MQSNILLSGGKTHQYKKWLKRFAIIVIFLGAALVCYNSLPYLLFGTLKWYEDNSISNVESQAVDSVLTYAYPGSTMIRADAGIWSWPAGDTVSVDVSVTFESSDSFDTIKNWYVRHSNGGQVFCECATPNLFPKEGLAKLDGANPGKTRYFVDYETTGECAIDCNRPSQQIR